MLNAFESVGAYVFDITLTDLDGKMLEKDFSAAEPPGNCAALPSVNFHDALYTARTAMRGNIIPFGSDTSDTENSDK
jgi:hypothetical protein